MKLLLSNIKRLIVIMYLKIVGDFYYSLQYFTSFDHSDLFPCELLFKGKMIDLYITIKYRIRIYKDPSFLSHKIQSVNNCVELFQFTIVGSNPAISPKTFFFTEVNIDGYFIAQQSGCNNDLAILLNFGRVTLCK